MAKRIVVTGLGSFDPLGSSAKESWENLLSGMSGAAPLQHEWVTTYDLPVTFAAETKRDTSEFLSRQDIKRLDPSSRFALIAGRQAFLDAGEPEYDPERFGVEWATGIGGVWTLISSWDTLRERGPRRVPPMTVPMLMPNAPGVAIGMDLKARAGIHTAVSACASSTESLVNAYNRLQNGSVDVVIAGGSEAAVHPLPIASFAALQALSKRNDSPESASRPYDLSRDGFVLGEGATAIMLETYEHAKARNAHIYAEFIAGAVTSDSYHITAPDPEGIQAARAVEKTLALADAQRTEVVHINAHATSTPVGDVAEYRALKRAFGSHLDNIAVTATKASTGHLLGGAGAIEAMFTILALSEKMMPPTINLTQQDSEIPLNIVTTPTALSTPNALALSNSFGFGGHNSVVAFRAI